MKKTFKILFFTFIFLDATNLYSNNINGIELRNIVNNWLKENNQSSNINILDELKYPYCDDSKMIISDISGNYNLIKVNCIDKNPWKIILRNKKIKEIRKKSKRLSKSFVLKNNLKSGTILKKENLIEINKKTSGQSVYISNISEILGKKLKRNMNKNISLQYTDLQNDWLIEKDSIVTIINNKTNITIKESGIAMENANFMDRLIVKNIKSGKVIQVFAKNKKNVVMNPKQF